MAELKTKVTKGSVNKFLDSIADEAERKDSYLMCLRTLPSRPTFQRGTSAKRYAHRCFARHNRVLLAFKKSCRVNSSFYNPNCLSLAQSP